MKDNKIIEKIIDDLIDEAALLAAENLGKNILEPEPIEFSKEHEAAMRRIFNKEKRKLLLSKIIKCSKRIAVFFLCAFFVLSVTVYSVEAWRIKVMNFIIEISQTHAEIKFVYEDDKRETYTSDDITFGYIPKGFKLEKRDIRANDISIVFKGEERYFVFSMNRITGLMGFDTEKADVKRTIINGNEAFISSNNNINILIWHDVDFLYRLSGTVEVDEMITIAENIKR